MNATPKQGAPTGVPASRFGPVVFGVLLLGLGGFMAWEAVSDIGDDEITLDGHHLAPLLVTGLWVLMAALFVVAQVAKLRSPVQPAAITGEPMTGAHDAETPETETQETAVPETAVPETENGPEDVPADDPADISWSTPALLCVALVGYAVTLEPLGFLISTAAFFFAAAVILGSRKLIRDGLIAVTLSTAVYFSFTGMLDISLPSGVLPI